MISDNREYKEILHRLKNHMTVINSLFRLKASTAETDAERSGLETTGCLVSAVTLVYQLLYQGNEDALSVSVYIRELLDVLEQTVSVQFPEVKYRLPGEDFLIKPEKAVPLGIMLAEQVLDGKDGAVTGIVLEKEGEHWNLILSGCEAGTSPGTVVLTDSLVSQLEGEKSKFSSMGRIFRFPADLLFLKPR